MKHETKEIIVLKAEVDEGMISIVNWFNKQYGVITLFCCQGDSEIIDGEMDLPYIQFFCNDNCIFPQKIKKMIFDIAQDLTGNESINFCTTTKYNRFGSITVYEIHMSGPSVLNKLYRLIEEKKNGK